MAETLPKWAEEIRSIYRADAANQFIISGNIYDRMLLNGGQDMGTIDDFLLGSMFGPFDVVLLYDVGNGIRCIKGQNYFKHTTDELPTQPRPAIEAMTTYLSYVANNNALNKQHQQVAIVIRDTQLVAPAGNAPGFELNATASLIRDWSTRSEFTRNSFATMLLTENINDLHPLLVGNDRAARIVVPLPSSDDLRKYLNTFAETYQKALRTYADPDRTSALAEQLVGVTISECERMLKQRHAADQPLKPADLVALKKQIIEKQGDGLIEFIESDKTLDDLIGQDEAKKTIRAHMKLWKENDIRAVPMGYLFAAPVGVGKTFLVECLAGEAGVPVVRVKNFRTKWVGDTESKQEKIIRLIRALGRCFVFFDEADATLGKRDSDSDGGLSARIYSSWAQEMSNSKNRGKIVWLLATSRADCIEIDLKRPGRIDVAIPLFPAGTPEEGYKQIQGLCKREGLEIPDDWLENELMEGKIKLDMVPKWLTAGAAEALAKKVYAETKVDGKQPFEALESVLRDYQPAVPLSKMEEQIRIAANNCTDVDFIPEPFRKYKDA